MQNPTTAKIEELSRIRHEPPARVIAEAIDIGLSKMWVESILGQYLHKEISRTKALQLVGLNLVRLAEHQQKIVQADIEWGLSRAKNRR